MMYRTVEDPHSGYWNIVTTETDEPVALVWEKADAFAIVSALNGSTPRPEGETRDAARYRWLREKHNQGDEQAFVYGAKGDLDAYIDGEMQSPMNPRLDKP